MPLESAKNRMAFQQPDANGKLPYRKHNLTPTSTHIYTQQHQRSLIIHLLIVRNYYADGNESGQERGRRVRDSAVTVTLHGSPRLCQFV